jgi:hypothetical protein
MPLRRYQRAASGPGEVVLRRFPPSAREMPLSPAPSALAVLPGFDGFLRCAPCRLCTFRGVRVIADSLPHGRRSCNRPWGSCRFGSCCLSALSRSVRVPFGARSARIGRSRAACAGASPVMPYPSKRSPRQQPSRRHRRAIPSRRCRSLRWSSSRLRTAAPTPLAAAGLKALLRCRVRKQGRCCQRSCPDAPMGLFLERAGGVLPWMLGGQAAQYRDKSRSPGRTRVHPVFRPRSDLDDGATGPCAVE